MVTAFVKIREGVYVNINFVAMVTTISEDDLPEGKTRGVVIVLNDGSSLTVYDDHVNSILSAVLNKGVL